MYDHIALVESPSMTVSYRLIFWWVAALVFGSLTGCYSGYRMDIEQGNVVTLEQRAQLKLGMGRREARFVLGSPLIMYLDDMDNFEETVGTFNSSSLFLRRCSMDLGILCQNCDIHICVYLVRFWL